MAKKKKKSGPDVCPKCGGPKRGRGYIHKPPCGPSKAKGSGGFGVAALRKMDVEELGKLRDVIGQIMADKADEIDTEIARLQELKKSVKAMAGK